MALSYTGVIINLDSRPERLAVMQKQLAVLGLAERYQRLSAVVGIERPGSPLPAGAVGCFLSHRRALHVARPGMFLHVLEDDVELSRQLAPALQAAIAAGALAKYDIIFTGLIVVPTNLHMLRWLESSFAQTIRSATPSFNIVDLKGFIFAGTGSYLVNPGSVGKVGRLLDERCRAGWISPLTFSTAALPGTADCGPAAFCRSLRQPRLMP
jgi:GR25 family glycosyltransferase involved in LPS biosynthesis